MTRYSYLAAVRIITILAGGFVLSFLALLAFGKQLEWKTVWIVAAFPALLLAAHAEHTEEPTESFGKWLFDLLLTAGAVLVSVPIWLLIGFVLVKAL